MTRRKRPRGSLRRRRPHLEPRQFVLIVCEDGKTEPSYFNSLWKKLRVPTVQVDVVGRGAAPITVVDEAIARRKERKREVRGAPAGVEYDQIWCVIDVEELGKNPSLPDARGKARAHRLSVALSNPCFEYWFLLHFVHTGRAFANCREVIRSLRDRLPGYTKGSDVFEQIYPRTDEAIRNAKAVEKQQWQHEADPVQRNPSTQVYQLVEELRRIATPPYASSQ